MQNQQKQIDTNVVTATLKEKLTNIAYKDSKEKNEIIIILNQMINNGQGDK